MKNQRQVNAYSDNLNCTGKKRRYPEVTLVLYEG